MQIRHKMSGEERADITADDISNELAERVRAEYQNRRHFPTEVTARLIPIRIGKIRRT